MQLVRDILDDVKFTFATIVCSVIVAVRMSPTNNRDKKRLGQLKLREEQDRIIRVINGINYPVNQEKSI
jgi:hypothetical protein